MSDIFIHPCFPELARLFIEENMLWPPPCQETLPHEYPWKEALSPPLSVVLACC